MSDVLLSLGVTEADSVMKCRLNGDLRPIVLKTVSQSQVGRNMMRPRQCASYLDLTVASYDTCDRD